MGVSLVLEGTPFCGGFERNAHTKEHQFGGTLKKRSAKLFGGK